jgi:hypothetical protein
MSGTYSYAKNQAPMVWQGAWDASLVYNPGHVVSYGGSNYVALVDSTNVIPTDGATWAVSGETGSEPSLGATFVGYGDVSNLLAGSPGFTWTDSTNTVQLGVEGAVAYVQGAAATMTDTAGAELQFVSGLGNGAGNGGDISLIGGEAGATTGFGGSVYLTGGVAHGAGCGSLHLTGGAGDTNAAGGDANLGGGTGGSADKDGGATNVFGGDSGGDGNAGPIFITGGNAPGSGVGGIVYISGGTSGTGTPGRIVLQNLPTSASGLPSGALWNSSGVLHIV